MGFFENQRRKTDVRNLVPYELWKGDQAEPEDLEKDSPDAVSIHLHDEELQGSEQGFIAMGIYEKPKSESHLFLDLPMHLLLQPPEVLTSTNIHSVDLESL